MVLRPQLGTANLQLPCGRCLGCKEAHAIQWAQRCSHEASQHRWNTFLTATYDDENLPAAGHLKPEHLQKFLKRLRKNADRHSSTINRNRGLGIRFIASGEYGDTNGRPHYHALLFNCGFSDAKACGTDAYGDPLYQSATLDQLWGHGQIKFGYTSGGAAAAYIAKYTLKKTGRIDADADGIERPAPFLRMSNRPAIGMEWLKKYANDLTHGYITDNEGKKRRIPRHYIKTLKNQNNPLTEQIELAKYTHIKTNQGDSQSPERLADAEKIHRQKHDRQKRKM